MKRTLLTTAVLLLLVAGAAFAQSADEEYIKAMQLSDNCQKAQALKAYLGKYAGQGTTYENYAWAYYCLTPCPSKPAQESIQAGEKALGMSGIDDTTRIQLLANLSTISAASGQYDKAKGFGQKLADFGRSMRDKNPAQAADWNKVIVAGYLLIGDSAEKAKDYSGAADAYIAAFQVKKDPKVSATLKKLGKTLYDSQRYQEAEKIFRNFYAAAPGPESAVILGQTLYKAGKTDEALRIYKEAYAKRKSGELAYNIGIILANKAKTDASARQEAMMMLIEAGILYPAQSKQCLGMAQNLFLGDNKELKESFAKIEEHNKALQELTKTFNERFGDKSEDDLSDSDKRTMRKLNEAIAAEQEAINKIQAEQKSVLDKFNQLIAQVRAKLGK